MALKALMLRKQINEKNKILEQLREKDGEFQTREAELERSIEEASTEEEMTAVGEAMDQFEQDKKEHEQQKATLEKEVGDLENQLQELEKEQPAPQQQPEARKDEKIMNLNTRTKFFGMNVQERDAFLARDEVKSFLQRTREMKNQNRSVSGADLLIPTVVLELIRENIAEFSKLYKHINVRRVPGKARQTIMGTIPEAVWTEMCGKINELSLNFNAVEVDGYKVGGFIPICNAILEDSDIALASEIISALGKAIGIALDKAILYGTGTKMPLGIVTRLAQAPEPENYPGNARPWKNLSNTNLLVISGKTDAALFKELVKASGAAKGKYSSGNRFWVMSDSTKASLTANALSINAAGAIVSGMNESMPVIGGAIETLDFIPDGVIIGGYGSNYLLAEREGASMAQSEHVRFLEDQTVFKGTARYDGIPVIAEAFVAIGINGTKPSADAVTFTEDSANKADGVSA